MAAVNNYYYNMLTQEEKQVYHLMQQGLTALAPSFSVPMLTAQQYSDIYTLVRLDHPEIFCTEKFGYRYYQNAASVEIVPEYMFPKDKMKTHIQAMEARITKLVRPAQRLTEREKEQYIHDFICQNVKYDKLKKGYSHEIIGVLGNGIGVCEGIAKTVKILCDRLGIWCIIVICNNNLEKGIKYRHAWNIVKINGKYYHLDATFDNTLGKGEMVRYDYFNLCDRQIFRDHEPSIWKIPACEDGSYSYYQEKKLSFTKLEDVEKRVGQNAKKGRDFIFNWRGSYLTKEVLAQLLEIVNRRALDKGKKALIGLNWPQAVMLVRFAPQDAQEILELEDANEGEKYAESEDI